MLRERGARQKYFAVNTVLKNLPASASGDLGLLVVPGGEAKGFVRLREFAKAEFRARNVPGIHRPQAVFPGDVDGLQLGFRLLEINEDHQSRLGVEERINRSQRRCRVDTQVPGCAHHGARALKAGDG